MHELLLVRHAIAFERDPKRWPDDHLRPLTLEGKRKFRKAAAGLAEWVPRVERVLTSPLMRAQETARLLSEVARWPDAIETPALAPPGDARALLSLLSREKAKSIAMVGHEPDLSSMLATCLTGQDDRLRFKLKKGGVAHIVFPGRVRPGEGVLLAFIPPRGLRRMQGQ